MWKYKGDLMPMIDNIRWTFVVNRIPMMNAWCIGLSERHSQ